MNASLSFDTAEPIVETKLYARSSVAHVGMEAASSAGVSGPSSLVGNESSFRSSSSSSQESDTQGSVPPQLRIISLVEGSGRIISAESPRGSARVLAWHPTSTGGGVTDSHSVTSELSATSTGKITLCISRPLEGSACIPPPKDSFHLSLMHIGCDFRLQSLSESLDLYMQ